MREVLIAAFARRQISIGFSHVHVTLKPAVSARDFFCTRPGPGWPFIRSHARHQSGGRGKKQII